MTFEEAQREHQNAKKQLDRAKARFKKASIQLDKARRNLELQCTACNTLSKVTDVEVVLTYPASDVWDEYGPEVSWFCANPECSTEYHDIEDGRFPNGLRRLAKCEHHVYNNHESLEVSRLREPSRARRMAEEKAELKKRRIEEAKKLLKSEGLLNE